MDNLQTLIGERIAKQRKQLRISQTELAEQLGKSLRTAEVRKWRNRYIRLCIRTDSGHIKNAHQLLDRLRFVAY